MSSGTIRRGDVVGALVSRLSKLCEVDGIAEPPGLAFRRLGRSAVDVRLFFPGSPRTAVAAASTALESDPAVGSVRIKRNDVSVRLTEDAVRAVFEGLSDDGVTPPAGLLAGRTHVVNFLNPNATKPLHVGHLRNVALGMALSAQLETVGAQVVRQCYVCDIGRSVCEAMAGYEAFHAHGDPASEGLAPDRFVGRCYADYVASVDDRDGARDGDPAAREAVLSDDRADALLRDWSDGEEGARDLWRRIRGWALEGQAATLARLGVRWDRTFFEADSFAAVGRVVADGLERGYLVRGHDREVLYPTDRAEYSSLTLVREDGFPTEHARVIGLFVAEDAAGPAPDSWTVVCGEEWGTAGQVELEIARRSGAAELASRVAVVTHGMVTVAGSKMKSRDGRAILIDDLLDEVGASATVDQLVATARGAVQRDAVVDLLVRGFFLTRRASKGIEFEPGSFTDERANPALAVARAWCRASASQGAWRSEAVRGAALDDDLRTAVLQAFQLRQLQVRAAEGLDVDQLVNLMKFANGLAAWYLEREPTPALDAAVHAVLAGCASSLGMALAGPTGAAGTA